MLKDFINLIYPRLCAACDDYLHKGEIVICTHCVYTLPKTSYHQMDVNPVQLLLAGRVNINAAGAYYLFSKGDRVQRMVHRLKYKGDKEIGREVGRLYGLELKESNRFQKIELVIPVPLHKEKLKKRGYNQSEWLAKGISDGMRKTLEVNAVKRIKISGSQTSKTRYGRWENVKEVFEVTEKEKLKGKHILLVDDVITTGSTLEACARKILEIEGTNVSIATMAYAAN